MSRGGRPKKSENLATRTINIALTDRSSEMLDEIQKETGAASRSEAVRGCIAREWKRVQQQKKWERMRGIEGAEN